MSRHPSQTPAEARPAPSGELSLADVWTTLLEQKWFIGALVAIGLLIGLVYVLVAPSAFRARTKVVSSMLLDYAPDASSVSPLRRVAGQYGLGAFGGSANMSTLLPQILSSRDFLVRLARRNDGSASELPAILGIKEADPARREERVVDALRARISSAYDFQSDITTVFALFPDPVLSATVANATVEELNLFLHDLRSSHVGEKARFIAGRLVEVEAALRQAEDALTLFRERNRSIVTSPQLSRDEARLQREVTAQEQIYLTLKSQYEIARIDETKNMPDLSVVERAAPPVRRHSPRPAPTMALALLLSLLAGALAAFPRQHRALRRRPERV